ncbi:MAG: CTP synthase [Patescibacteria group bacterium]|nr:CTP synthase [Patescibacteria group bacterium]
MVEKIKQDKTKYIFVVGGVMSGVGKGVTTASIAMILQSKGYNVSAIKIDPYINVDAGTMNPVEHGEVFVTDDGDETDQDVGNYERFLNKNIYRENYMTTGRVYLSVIQKERNLEYGGKCVEVVPHIPMEVIDRIHKAVEKTNAEIMVIEIGGTVGEYQNLLFLEAGRMMKLYNPENVLFVMVSFLPIPSKLGEMKTKPTQYAIHSLNAAGIQPNFIVARAEVPVDEPRRAKIAINCGIAPEDVISAPDIDSIYDVPLNFEKDNLGDRILEKLKLAKRHEDLKAWRDMVARRRNARQEVKIGIVGKYFTSGHFCLSDSYLSVIEALKHAATFNNCRACLTWINTDDIEKAGTASLKKFDGIIVPQGWGSRGAEGKIATIKYCRENKKPYFGLCYGMQMAVIEFARNVLGYKDANSAEVNPETKHPVIHVMPGQAELIAKKQFGGTIRLGGWPCKIKPETHLYKAYQVKKNCEDIVMERHRHRFEYNNDYRELMEKKGLTVSGTSPDNMIVEAVEIADHPFFIGTQFHPEYISRPLAPHPLFVEFVKVCLTLKNKKGKLSKK